MKQKTNSSRDGMSSRFWTLLIRYTSTETLGPPILEKTRWVQIATSQRGLGIVRASWKNMQVQIVDFWSRQIFFWKIFCNSVSFFFWFWILQLPHGKTKIFNNFPTQVLLKYFEIITCSWLIFMAKFEENNGKYANRSHGCYKVGQGSIVINKVVT